MRLSNSFSELGYNEGNLRNRYMFEGAPSEAFVFPKSFEKASTAISGLDVFVHLFMGQESISVPYAERLLGRQCFSVLQELNLILIEEEGVSCQATIRLLPTKYPRAILFAEFNKKLNGVENITKYCGDLFKPIQSRSFDRIVAHPPYIPSLTDSITYKHDRFEGLNDTGFRLMMLLQFVQSSLHRRRIDGGLLLLLSVLTAV